MARRIAVIGLGVMGKAVARYLARHGAYVVAVDHDQAQVAALASDVSRAVCIDSRDRDGLLALASERLQGAVVAIRADVEASVMATLVLCRHLRVPEVFARAVNDNHAEILEAVGATTVVQVEREMGRRVAQSILWPQFRDFFAVTGDLALVETTPTEEMVGQTIGGLDMRARYGALVLAVRRGAAGARETIGGDKVESAGSEIINLPGPAVRIERDDVLVVIGLGRELARHFRAAAGSVAEPLDDAALDRLIGS